MDVLSMISINWDVALDAAIIITALFALFCYAYKAYVGYTDEL